MSTKRSYNRFFIIFQEEDRGYGMGPDRPPTGYVKIEVKNDKSKVTAYVQNLKSIETAECLYKCYLISHQEDKDNVAYLGIINIDDFGRGEASWETGAENAFDCKIPIEKFNGAAIIADKEGANAVISPLAGYMSKEKFEWRSKINIEKNREKIETEEKEDKEQARAEQDAKKFEEYEKHIMDVVEENKKSENEVNENIENAKEESKEEIVNQPLDADYRDEKTETITEDNNAEDTNIVIEEQQYKVSEDIKVDETKQIEELMEGFEKKFRERVIEDIKELLEVNEKANINQDELSAQREEAQEEINREEDYNDELQDIITDDEIRGKHKEKECKEEKDEYNFTTYDNYFMYSYRYIMRKKLDEILRCHPEMDHHKELKNCRLWRIDIGKYMEEGNKVQLYPCYDLVYYPMIYNPQYNYYNYIKNHGHYLFGIKHGKSGEVKAIVFGIPGRKCEKDQPFKGKTGFVKWITWGGRDGYWIMVYDPMTGMVKYPNPNR